MFLVRPARASECEDSGKEHSLDQTASFLFIGPTDNIKSELTVLPLLFHIIIPKEKGLSS